MAPTDFIVISVIVLAIGVVHGGAIARALRLRFPSFKTHAKFVSITILLLFSINSILVLHRFGQPHTSIEMSSITLESLPNTLIGLIGMDGGFLSILSISVMVIIFVLTRLVRIEGVLRYFVLAVSAGTIFLSIVYRLLGLVPDGTQILSYAVYHAGFNAGLFLVLSKERLGRALLINAKSGMRALVCRLFDALTSKFRI